MAQPSARLTSSTIGRAARHIHAALVAHPSGIDGSSALESIVRETGASEHELVATANKVLAAVEEIDTIGVEPNARHDVPTPIHNGAEVAEALAGALAVHTGVPMLVLCGHRYELDAAPEWCRAAGGFTIVPDQRAVRPPHP